MPSVIKTKRSSSPGAVPSAASLADGELAVNTADGRLYLKIGSGPGVTVVCIGTVTSAAAALILAQPSLAAIQAALGIVAPPVPYLASGFQLFTSSGTFNTPAGFSQAWAVVVGGGGGGSAGTGAEPGGNGGSGGFAANLVAISGAMAVTVGLPGNGNNSTANNGTSGTSSSFGGLLATGGGGGNIAPSNGSNGSGTGGAFNGSVNVSLFNEVLMYPNSPNGFTARNQLAFRQGAGGSTAGLTYSTGGLFKPGVGGEGESTSGGNDAAGGVGGAVFIFW